jgi:stage II sporulation protein AA (anti-sigma F factor antagonist)
MDFDKKPKRDVLSSNLKSPSHPGPGAKNGESDLFLTKEGNAMEILAKSADRNLLLELSGELDHHGARTALREMEEALDAALPRKLVLDLSGVTFMDSSGIAVILRARQKMQLLDGGLLVRGVPPQARRVLEAAGVNRLVTIK